MISSRIASCWPTPREPPGTRVWAYCLMPNHVHLIVVPADRTGLRGTFANAHRRYARLINARNRWTGHLWQGRYGAVAMDEISLWRMRQRAMSRLNPVRARLRRASRGDWPWSSARAHLTGRDDGLVEVAPLLERIGDFVAFPRCGRGPAGDPGLANGGDDRPSVGIMHAWVSGAERKRRVAGSLGNADERPKEIRLLSP